MRQALKEAVRWVTQGEAVALATVLHTWGSAPCPAGSFMAISASGAIAGAVSGGCVEGAVYEGAQRVLQTGTPERLQFGVVDELAWSVGLACGGQIEIHIELFSSPLFASLLKDMDARHPVVLARRLDRQEGWLLPSPTAPLELTKAASALLGHDKPGLVALGEEEFFLQPITPPPRLIIVGAVQIAQALVPMARCAGYDCVVVDPRGAFSTTERFPGTQLLRDWPEAAFAALGLDARSAVITLTHDC